MEGFVQAVPHLRDQHREFLHDGCRWRKFESLVHFALGPTELPLGGAQVLTVAVTNFEDNRHLHQGFSLVWSSNFTFSTKICYLSNFAFPIMDDIKYKGYSGLESNPFCIKQNLITLFCLKQNFMKIGSLSRCRKWLHQLTRNFVGRLNL